MILEYQIQLSYPSSPSQPPLILRIPFHLILKQTINVEAWLLYLGFCICGVPGSLTTAAGPTSALTDLLRSSEEDITCEYTPSSHVNIVDLSASKSKRSSAKFAQGCKNRDGGCVLQNVFSPSDAELPDWERVEMEELARNKCQAIHLLPHPTGIDLISKARAPNAADHIHNIDDIRNGLTMMGGLQADLMLNYSAAFLRVPNQYMKVEDAVLHDLDNRAPDEIHCHFLTDKIRRSPDVLSHLSSGRLWDNKCLRQPEDRSLWPPPFLWDYVFGVTAIRNWATAETLEKYDVSGESGDGASEVTEERDTVGDEMRDIYNGYDVWDIMACIVPAHRVPSQLDAQQRVTQWLSTNMGS